MQWNALRNAFLCVGLCLGFSVAGVAPALAAATLRIGNGPEPDTLDPQRARGVSAGNILRDLYEGLTELSADGRIVPAAAASWQVDDDGLVYTFRLREDARWSNGDPVLAGDFVEGLRRAVTPATGATFAQMYAPVRGARAVMAGTAPPESLGVDAPEPLVLRIELDQPTLHLPGMLAHPSAFPVHRPSLRDYGDAFTRPGRLVSNGAYRLQDWVMHSHVTLARSPYFRDAAATQIERLQYVVTEDVGSELKRYRAGELDITYDIPPVLADRIRSELGGELRVAPYLGVYYYGLNLTHPPFAGQPALRAALAMTIDRQVIADKVLNGLGLPAFGWVPPGTGDYPAQRPDWADWPYARRVAEARRLYAKAGYGPDRPLEVEIRYNTHEGHRRVAIAVAAMWKQALGMRTRLVNEEFKVFLNNRRLRRDTQVFRAAWMADYLDASSFTDILHSMHGQNDTGWRDAEYDRLLAEAAAAADPAARSLLLQRAEQRVLTEWPVIPIYFYVSRHLVKPHVLGWTDNLLDYHYSKQLRLEPR